MREVLPIRRHVIVLSTLVPAYVMITQFSTDHPMTDVPEAV